MYGKFIGKRIANNGRLDDYEMSEGNSTIADRKEISTVLSFSILALPIILILSDTS
ncbi:Gluconate permease OS=Lysinibacillus sphaericus OX=1421 GN=LS41612_08190 PE=4 SV=1 [Lysinibacillus sphaericus]